MKVKSKLVQRDYFDDLVNIAKALFTPKHSFEFIANSPLSVCTACIEQATKLHPSIDRSVFSVKVDVTPFPPSLTEFSIRFQQIGRYSFWRRIYGHLEVIDANTTLVRGESKESGFIRRMVIATFLVLLGIANDKIAVVIFLSLCGLFYGPLFTLLIKHRHVKYLKLLLNCNDKSVDIYQLVEGGA